MAQTPKCDLHKDHDADYIIGMVTTGEQLFLCQEGAAHFGLTLALQLLDPAEIINAAQAIGAKPIPNGEETAGSKPARKRAKAKPSKQRAAEPAAEGLEETPPAGDDR